ncbi:MAG: DUF3037 domain-containing protein [Flavobacteriales bacterium]
MSTKYVFSLLRFVPDPLNGEFVNVGFIVGSQETEEWHLDQIQNPKRAECLDFNNIFKFVQSDIYDIRKKIDEYTESFEELIPIDERVNEDWLHALSDDLKNVLQVTQPTPILSENIQEAKELIWKNFLVEPEVNKQSSFTKRHCISKINQSYKKFGIPEKNISKRSSFSTKKYNGTFDFAIFNGHALQISQTWSFEIQHPNRISKDVKAWSWVIRDLRESNGKFENEEGRLIEIPHDIEIDFIYQPPSSNLENETAFEEAIKAADECGLNKVSLDNVDQVAESAKKLIGNS